jgi:hypothetical protein
VLFEPAEANVVSIPTGDAPDITDCRQLAGRLALVAKMARRVREAHPISACITPVGILVSPIYRPGNWNNDQAYYRRRFPTEYALANRVDHPKTVYLREADVTGKLDPWLGQAFGPGSLDATLNQLADQAAAGTNDTSARTEAAQARIADLDKEDRPVPRQPGRRGETPPSSARGSPRPRPRKSPPGPRSGQLPDNAGWREIR